MFRCLAWIATVAALGAAAPGPRAAPGLQLSDHGVGKELILAELRAWKESGLPDVLHFQGDDKGVVRAHLEHPDATRRASPSYMGLFPDADDIKFHLFTTNDTDDVLGKEVEVDAESLLKAGFVKNRLTKVVIHGFANSIKSDMIQDIKNAYLGSGSFNVIGVDWSKLCPVPLYVTARLNVPTAGKRVGELLHVLLDGGLVDVQDLHVIGHSLGAHVSGLAGKHVAELGYNLTRITGLDPAWPLFMITPEDDRLNKKDALVVDVIHTCAGMLGFSSALGTSDFYPNGGSGQPGCGLDVAGTCAHGRSYVYFVDSIKAGTGLQAVYCNSDKDARSGECTDRHDGCMGDEVFFKETGSYFLKTNIDKPIKLC